MIAALLFGNMTLTAFYLNARISIGSDAPSWGSSNASGTDHILSPSAQWLSLLHTQTWARLPRIYSARATVSTDLAQRVIYSLLRCPETLSLFKSGVSVRRAVQLVSSMQAI